MEKSILPKSKLRFGETNWVAWVRQPVSDNLDLTWGAGIGTQSPSLFSCTRRLAQWAWEPLRGSRHLQEVETKLRFPNILSYYNLGSQLVTSPVLSQLHMVLKCGLLGSHRARLWVLIPNLLWPKGGSVRNTRPALSLHIHYLIWFSPLCCEVDKVGINFIIITSSQIENRECVLCSRHIVQWTHDDARSGHPIGWIKVITEKSNLKLPVSYQGRAIEGKEESIAAVLSKSWTFRVGKDLRPHQVQLAPMTAKMPVGIEASVRRTAWNTSAGTGRQWECWGH